MSANLKKYLKGIAYLLSIHLTALLLMTFFRLLFLFAVENQLTPDVRGDVGSYLTAFVRGLWFDNVIGCYLLLVPLVVMTIAGVAHYYRRPLFRFFTLFFSITYALVFMATAANIPYFAYFTKILNSSIWNWTDEGGTALGMMFGEASYYLYIFYFVAATALFAFLVNRYSRFWECWLSRPRIRTGWRVWKSWTLVLAVGLPLIGLCLFGIRGRTGYNPIKVSAAYFCGNPILNQLGVNPMFCLLTSTLDDFRPENRTLHLMNPQEAVTATQQLLQRQGIEDISPIARQVTPAAPPTGQNVVLVFMESMSALLMERFGNTQQLTPHLDSLYRESMAFSNFYSAGTHTNHALYATLYSFPSIMKRNAMKGSAIPSYSGLPTVLRDNGYRTLFFMTHESQYDNMNAFFRSNGFDEIYAQENYPKEKIANHFGVQDDFLFEYALPVLRKTAESGKPFFASLLTIANHPPYVVPDYFTPRSDQPEWQVVEYADWSIGRFMDAVSREPWFDNTLFVFLGDHGKMLGQADCELPESYNHVPFFIYGKGISPEERTDFAGQVDVAPTLLGLLRVPYVQNNFGINLLEEKRPCMFYTADKTVAARDSQYLYVYNPDADREFCYSLSNGKVVPSDFLPMHVQLKDYCFPMLQATEYLVQQGLTTNRPRRQEAATQDAPATAPADTDEM